MNPGRQRKMSRRIKCSECVKKEEEIFKLREENNRLKAKLRCQERKIDEGFFGSSTPSSKKPIKGNSKKEEKNKGGAKPGHKGKGRSAVLSKEADRIEKVKAESCCPECSAQMEDFGSRERTVIDFKIKVEKIIYVLERKRCPKCKKVVQAKTPGVLPKGLYGNNMLSHIATEHYLNGIPLGHLEKQTGIGYGALIQSMHQLGKILKDVPGELVEEYRKSPVKHADETGWRTDGQNGYAWLFSTPDMSIFRFRKTRAGKIAQEVLGQKALPGVLVVDRYAGYNKSPCDIQYCYAHLLRLIQDLEKEFPDNEEIKIFVMVSAPLLAEAMNLRMLPISDKEFYKRAEETKKKIIATMNQSANHAGIQNIQNIFRDNENRLYHWAKSRVVPADNNLSERELRRLVVARKVSFGSHSEAGAKTREILMTVLKTLKARSNTDIRTSFKNFLDKLTLNPAIDIYHTLFPQNTT